MSKIRTKDGFAYEMSKSDLTDKLTVLDVSSFYKDEEHQDYVVNWSRSSEFNRAKTTMTHVYLKPCITWSDISGNSFAGRYCKGGFMFDVKGSCAFSSLENNGLTPITSLATNV